MSLEAPDSESSELEDIFRKKQSKRMVWLVPSVLLHVVVGLVWYFAPEDAPRELESRRMVIKQEQAEQLQDFVEDANLQELRNELKRLQEIKRSIEKIRSVQIHSLNALSDELQASVDKDASEVLSALLQQQRNFLNMQDAIVEDLVHLNRAYQEMSPLLESEAVDQLVPYAAKAMELRHVLQTEQEAANKQFLLLRAQLEEADSVLGWLKSQDILDQWEIHLRDQQKVLKLYSAAMDEQKRLQHTEDVALKRIVREGATYVEKVQTSISTERSAQEMYEEQKKLYEEELKASQLREKEQKLRVDTILEEYEQLRSERSRLSKVLASIKTNDPTWKDQRVEVLAKIKAVDVQLKSFSTKLQVERKIYNQSRHTSNQAKHKVRRLRAPSPMDEKVRERMVESMRQSLDVLRGSQTGLAMQREAYDLQTELVQRNQKLLALVQAFLGGDQ